MTEENINPQRNPYTVWFLTALFVVPIVIATYLFYFGNTLPATGNHGDLIQPMLDIELLQMKDENGNIISREELTHKWRMLLIVSEDCDKACEKSLYYMRQVNIASGKYADRIQHMLIHTSPMNADFEQLVKTQYPNTLHAYARSDILSHVFYSVDKDLYSNAIYVMDPIGNIMMRFSADKDPKLLIKDLKRLLKISRIG